MKFAPRQKKYRAFDHSTKKFLTNTNFKIIGQDSLIGVFDNKLYQGESKTSENDLHLEITESIGLIDSKGVEIYEGDILDINMDYYALVEWRQSFASFCLTKKGWAFPHYFGESVNPKFCTVVGNMFENPSILPL